MIRQEICDTLELCKIAKLRTSTNHKDGFRPLHTHLKNEKYTITWVKGLDDPNNAPELVAQREQEKTNQLRKEELQNKSNITLPEMQELVRLSL